MRKRTRSSPFEGYQVCWNWMQTSRMSVPIPLTNAQIQSMLERLAAVSVSGTSIEVHNRNMAVHYSNTSVIKLEGMSTTAALHAGGLKIPSPREFFIVPKSASEYAVLQDWVTKACEYEDRLQHNLAILHTQLSSEEGVHPMLADLLEPFWKLRVNKHDSTPGIHDLLKMLTDGLALQTVIGMDVVVRPVTPVDGGWSAGDSTVVISWVE